MQDDSTKRIPGDDISGGDSRATDQVVVCGIHVHSSGLRAKREAAGDICPEGVPLDHIPGSVWVQPNRGQPEMTAGQLTYRQTSEAFAEDILTIVKTGADAVGGCCGTTPEFIQLIRARLEKEGFLKDRG